ncbi:MAG TPA: sortase, partial [Catenuloplanes sp.]
RRVPLDTVVTLDTTAGARRYRVVARRTADKQRLPADLFARGGPPRLALITCGGDFRDGHYERNVIVYAVPA